MLAERTRALRAALALTIGLVAVVAGVAGSAPRAVAVGETETVLVVVAPISTPESHDAFISADALEQYTSPLGLLTRQLDAIINLPVTIAIDPRVIASIRVLGSSAPVTATAWLNRLESASNETFALTYGDSDITLGTQAGSPRVLHPESFDFAIDETLFVDAPEQTPAPLETAAPPEVPTSESLVSWDYSLSTIAWPRAATVVGSDLKALADSGYDTVMLSSANVENGSGPVSTLEGMTAVITDDAVSSAVRAAVASRTVDDWQSAMTTATSLLTPGVTVVTLDRGIPLTGTQRAETLLALESNPEVTLGRFDDLLSESAPAAATLIELAQDATAVERVQRVLDAERSIERFAAIAQEPGSLTAPRRLEVLALLAIAWNDNPNGWTSATDQFLTESADLRDSVQVVSGSGFLLLADSSGLPISVSNSLDQAVTVYITVRPQTALLAVGDSRVELVVEPNSQARGVVPVQAISNGTVQVLVTLTGATGVQVGAPATAEINVQAGWETPIVVATGALVVLIFAGGIVRNIVHRRRSVRRE